MNASTIILAVLVAAVFLAIVVGGLVRRINHKSGGCGCGCSGCANSEFCHPAAREHSK